MKFLKIFIFSLIIGGISVASAQTTQNLTMPTGISDPTQPTFKVTVCDGPDLTGTGLTIPSGYIPCNFNGAMMQVQHLIDICMVLGVFAAIVLFTYAGFLLMTGREADRKKAKDIFPKIAIGFLVMLSAWFIVYQLLNWLTGNGMFTKLLGNP